MASIFAGMNVCIGSGHPLFPQHASETFFRVNARGEFVPLGRTVLLHQGAYTSWFTIRTAPGLGNNVHVVRLDRGNPCFDESDTDPVFRIDENRLAPMLSPYSPLQQGAAASLHDLRWAGRPALDQLHRIWYELASAVIIPGASRV